MGSAMPRSGAIRRETIAEWIAGRPVAAEPSNLDLAMELAHDVRSPLGAIMTLTELLQSGACGPVTPAQKNQLHVILQAARGLSSVTEDVVEGGLGGAEAVAPFDLTGLLRTVRAVVQPMVESAGLRLLVRNDAPGRWIGNRGAITRVLLNLVTNALKFTSFGLVEFGARLVGPNEVEFFVRDTGTGLVEIPENPLGAEAGPPPRGQRWRRSGTGLGLHISRRLVQALGSTLEVESRPGCGCRFHFALVLRAC